MYFLPDLQKGRFHGSYLRADSGEWSQQMGRFQLGGRGNLGHERPAELLRHHSERLPVRPV